MPRSIQPAPSVHQMFAERFLGPRWAVRCSVSNTAPPTSDAGGQRGQDGVPVTSRELGEAQFHRGYSLGLPKPPSPPRRDVPLGSLDGAWGGGVEKTPVAPG